VHRHNRACRPSDKPSSTSSCGLHHYDARTVRCCSQAAFNQICQSSARRPGQGRTTTFVERTEGAGVEIAKRIVKRSAIMHADEGSHWDALHAGWLTRRINHSEAYSTIEGCTNQAESFFSRLRRMVRGQHHYVSPQYLHQYAAHAAWLEDHRELDNGALAYRALGLALGHKVSRNWKGYWQRRCVTLFTAHQGKNVL
ncbi:MAG: transposase, partial [Pseudolabrys sp.]|nr:transposase [Pseudolabrys sp.]